MRKLIVSMNLSLDGYLSDAEGGLEWHIEKWEPCMGEKLTKELSNADTIFLGRNTYDAMAAYWPDRPTDMSCPRDDVAYAVMMNRHKKVVYSTTLQKTRWYNTALASGKLKEIVHKLKEAAADKPKNIIVYGSATLVRALMKLNLVDEYQLWIHPILLGKGTSFFNKQNGKRKLTLSSHESFASGVLLLRYQPVNETF